MMGFDGTISAVGFDLGETIIGYEGVGLNWRAHYPRVLGDVASACGIALTQEHLVNAEAILLRYNTRENPRVEEIPAARIFGEVLAAWGVAPEAFLEPALDTFFGFFQRKAFRYPDVEDCLAFLGHANVRMGVLTDVPYGMPSRFVQQDLDLAGLGRHFDAVLTSVDVGFRKPHAAGFHALAEALGVRPEAMLYIGNEAKDIQGPREAGVAAILIDREGHAPDYGQTRSVRSLLELNTAILQ